MIYHLELILGIISISSKHEELFFFCFLSKAHRIGFVRDALSELGGRSVRRDWQVYFCEIPFMGKITIVSKSYNQENLLKFL